MKRLIAFFLVLVLIMPTAHATKKQQLRGVWVGSVANLDFPSDKGLSEQKLVSELDLIVENCVSNNINTIFFQVRPNSDALYQSDVFPWSEVLSGTQGKAPDNNFDPLSYIINKAHQNKIELHAWINPYRIGDISKACDKNPAKQNPEYTVLCEDGKTYYNPALPEVRELVKKGVLEIIENYDVDGIHFDDYFYPYDVKTFDDAKSYQKYGKDFADIADFRRNNVNILVKEVSELVHNKNKSLKFGISPFGIWANKKDNPSGSDTNAMSSYSEIYADSRYWVQNNLVDYICPQVYWSFENASAPFDKIVDWWNELCKGSKTKLYIGLAHYKLGTEEIGFDDPDQILRQITYCNTKPSVEGIVYFRYGTLMSPKTETSQSASTPAVTTQTVKITGPSNGYKTEGSSVSITGYCDPSKPLTLDGKIIPVTKHGYFSYYAKLSFGTNSFTFVNGEGKATATIRRVRPENSEGSNAPNVFPNGECSFFAGECLTFSVKTEQAANVYALVGDKKIPLVVTTDKSTYKGSFVLPNIIDGSCKLNVSYVVEKDGKQTTLEPKAMLTVLSKPLEMYTNAESYVYSSYRGGSMMDNYQYPMGALLSVTASYDDMYRLSTGKWIYKDSVTDVKPEQKLDIDTDKYLKTKIIFKNTPCYFAKVDDNGKLCIDFYHTAGDFPSVSKTKGVSFKVIRNSTKTRILFSVKADAVTGYYIYWQADGELSLYLYKKNKDGIFGKTIVIDAGHGGDDSGALGPTGSDGATESDLNLSVALLLKQKLEKQGAVVYLTRDSDKTLLLKDRAALIRSYNPDLMLSIHHNSVDRESDFNANKGVLTLYSREVATPLATALQYNIASGTGTKNIGMRKQSLNVCREYRYPCVLLECGFVCNPQEYEKLLTDNYKNTICNNIVLSLSDYFS